MVTRDTAWPEGTPCWVDLGVESIDKAITFYSTLFGWHIERGSADVGGYSIADVDGKAVAGIGPKQGPSEVPPFWTTYIAADDVDEIAGKIPEAGGQVLLEPMDVMDVGRMAIAADPTGAMFGIWQARKHIGVYLANEPGSVCWNENMSRDFEGNKTFYAAVFGYEYGDMSSDEFQYATIKVDGKDVGGIGAFPSDVPPEAPASWITYFAVSDTDATVDKLTELGGSVLRPAWDTPYGRMAIVTDDQSAVFALIGVSTTS